MGKLLYLLIFLLFGMIGSCEDQAKSKNSKENKMSVCLDIQNSNDFISEDPAL